MNDCLKKVWKQNLASLAQASIINKSILAKNFKDPRPMLLPLKVAVNLCPDLAEHQATGNDGFPSFEAIFLIPVSVAL